MVSQFLIEPNKNLITEIALAEFDDATREMLVSSEYWHKLPYTSVIAQRLLSFDDEIEVIKLTYLANLHMEYLSNKTIPKLGDFLKKILGIPPWNIQTFDKWWILKPLLFEYQVEAVHDKLSIDNLANLESTSNSRVAEWLSKIKQKARSS